MKKVLRRLQEMPLPGHPLSPDQFDEVMAQYAGTQPLKNAPKQNIPRRSPGSLERRA